MEGASETGADLGRAATEAVAGARETARTLHLKEDEATQQAARGALEAAQTLGPKVVTKIKEALADELAEARDATIEENDYKAAN